MNSAVNQFYQLTPDVIMEAVESGGWHPTGEYLQLNSYENRVFSLRLESEPFEIIAKFYRPGRWSRAGLVEEHDFLAELNATGIPADGADSAQPDRHPWHSDGIFSEGERPHSRRLHL